MRLTVLFTALIIGCSTTPVASPPASLPYPSYLPASAREGIARRMGRHGTEMAMMLWGVLLLDVSRLGPLADDIADRRNESDEVDAELQRLLPADFFALEATIGVAARELARLARAPNPDAVAIARIYGAMTETCVRCHDSYMRGPRPAAALLQGGP